MESTEEIRQPDFLMPYNLFFHHNLMMAAWQEQQRWFQKEQEDHKKWELAIKKLTEKKSRQKALKPGNSEQDFKKQGSLNKQQRKQSRVATKNL